MQTGTFLFARHGRGGGAWTSLVQVVIFASGHVGARDASEEAFAANAQIKKALAVAQDEKEALQKALPCIGLCGDVFGKFVGDGSATVIHRSTKQHLAKEAGLHNFGHLRILVGSGKYTARSTKSDCSRFPGPPPRWRLAVACGPARTARSETTGTGRQQVGVNDPLDHPLRRGFGLRV